MDIDVSPSIDINKSQGLCMHSLESTIADTEDLSVNKLKNDDYDFQKKDSVMDPSLSCSTSLTTTLKPISAMKGSREKQKAGPPQKMSVKWAPEVYDPVPTSVSHAVTNNKPQKQSKKNSKSKKKNGNKSSRGNKHKDKLAGKRGHA